MINENKIYIESLVSLFMVEDSIVKVLLMHKEDEPYKGYWMLPKEILTNEECIKDLVIRVLNNNFDFSDIYLSEVGSVSKLDRYVDNRVVGIYYLGVTDPVTVSLKFKYKEGIEYQWFPISNLPKLAYDHAQIVESSIKRLQETSTDSKVLKSIYPSDFTLPELQKMFENLLNITLDRRNFRKRLLNMDWIEDTGQNSEKRYGRPSKLYYFKENMKEKSFFN